MILEASSGYDFNEEEVKFVDLLSRKADGNKLVDILDLDELKKEMDTEGIRTDKFDELCSKMQNNGILEYHAGMGQTWITLNSNQVVRFQAHLKNISCPKCHKRPLRRKTITYCPDCGYQRDEDRQ